LGVSQCNLASDLHAAETCKTLMNSGGKEFKRPYYTLYTDKLYGHISINGKWCLVSAMTRPSFQAGVNLESLMADTVATASDSITIPWVPNEVAKMRASLIFWLILERHTYSCTWNPYHPPLCHSGTPTYLSLRRCWSRRRKDGPQERELCCEQGWLSCYFTWIDRTTLFDFHSYSSKFVNTNTQH